MEEPTKKLVSIFPDLTWAPEELALYCEEHGIKVKHGERTYSSPEAIAKYCLQVEIMDAIRAAVEYDPTSEQEIEHRSLGTTGTDEYIDNQEESETMEFDKVIPDVDKADDYPKTDVIYVVSLAPHVQVYLAAPCGGAETYLIPGQVYRIPSDASKDDFLAFCLAHPDIIVKTIEEKVEFDPFLAAFRNAKGTI